MNNKAAALYCRLSKDDLSFGESSSISTQKMILRKYAQMKNWTIYDIYVDDGWSGATKMPKEVRSLVKTYMEACKIGADEAIQYIHFESEISREAYFVSGVKLLDYEVERTEKINDNLYALTVLVKTIVTGDDYMRVYNFAAFIDDEWLYINGIGNIPSNLKDNLDEENYSYTSTTGVQAS